MRVFDDVRRTDRRPARADEQRFDFLNRSASQYFAHVRDLVEDWFAHLPTSAKAGVRGALRAGNDASAAAFWELYLHEGYRRSGFRIEIHPEVPGRSARPDFRMTRDDEQFLLEAVSVGRRASTVAEEARLAAVHSLLAELRISDFKLMLSTYGVGDEPLATRRLRQQLSVWVNTLNPDEVSTAVAASDYSGFESLPRFVWEDRGWSLELHAVPLKEEARGIPRRALTGWGPGEAVGVDNSTGIRRVLSSKYRKYGELDLPLVIAVQSNTEYPTRDYEFERALYGASSHRPAESALGHGHLFEEGFWIGANGWQNAHVPQVIAIAGLAPWLPTRSAPRCWRTLQPGVPIPKQPAWIAPMEIGSESLPGDSTPLHEHFGLSDDWPGMESPDFELE